MLKSLFGNRRKARIGEALYAAVADQARQPVFYTDLGVADRIDARFELYTLHALLLILRLRDEDGARDGQAGQEPSGDTRGTDAAQSLFDTYVSALDNALRELGVSDVAVSKKMRKLGEALYGRMTAYEPALRAGDADALTPLLARNVYDQADAAAVAVPAAALARYAIAARAHLARQDFDRLMRAPLWPEIKA